MRTLILSGEEIHEVVSRIGVDRFMDELIARLHKAFAEFDDSVSDVPARTGFYYDLPQRGLMEWMPFFRRNESVLMKMVGYHPENPQALRLPTILSTISVFDCADGHLAAMVDGTLLTAMRTGAASAVASAMFANHNSKSLGIIGCGAQSVTQLHAMCRLFPLQRAFCYDIDQDVAESLAARAKHLCPTVTIEAKPLPKVVASADILCVATSIKEGQGPVFQSLPTQPWLHINAVGSDVPGKIELPQELFESSFVCADNLEQARREGECQQLAKEQLAAELHEVARCPENYQHLRQERTVFDSTGWALEDFVAVELLLEYAAKLGHGTSISLAGMREDPRNPYAFLCHTDLPVKTASAVSSVA